MKRNLLFTLSFIAFIASVSAQTYAPITTTGYTLDAVAENTTALSTTGGAIDGSNYILYSAAYGAIYGGNATGLPNNGSIVNGSRSYQLQSYTGPNMLFVPAFTSDSIIFTTPAPYPSLSLLAFATEGSGTFDAKVRLSDGTTEVFSSLSLADWFTGTNTVITGFDRATRTSGTPANIGSAGNPRMYYVDLNLSCLGSQQNVERIVIVNTGNNARICVMAVSGASGPVFTATSSPVTCSGGSNGTATVTVNNGVPPFTFTWPSPLAQNSNTGTVLPPGVVTFTVTDASNCTFTSNVSVSQAIVPDAVITITASALQVCSGSPVQLVTNGASTYTWSNNTGTSATTVNPVGNTLFSVVATTSDNCTVSGSITINSMPLPVTVFTVIPANLCNNASPIPLSASPSGGTFSGVAVIFNSFYSNSAGVGTHTVAYTYTDQDGCTSVNTATTTVSSPTTNISFTITPTSICLGAAPFTLNAQPAGGTYTGSAVSPTGVFSPSLAGLGTRTVSYSYTDAGNCTVRKVSSIQVTTCTAVGLTELTNAATLEVFPNPNNGTFSIKADKNMRLNIMNELGQVIETLDLTSTTTEVSISHLASGIYFLQSHDGTIKQKIVLSK